MRCRQGLRRDEGGQVLVYVVMVLVVALLVIPPLLDFTYGAGRSAQIREDRMLQVYAADAGIEDAFYKVTNSHYSLPEHPDYPAQYSAGNVNGYEVDVEIDLQEQEGVYKITSTATGWDGQSVTVEAYTSEWDYDFLLDHALSSYGDIDLDNNVEVEGNITLNGNITGNPKKYDINGDVIYGVPAWPEADVFATWYWNQVSGPCGPLEGNFTERGGCYYPENLTVSGETLSLTGTVCVGGDVSFAVGSELHLNNNTLFANGTMNFQPQCDIYGPGCIIAVGDVTFKPKQMGEDFIFVMSLAGEITALPNGSYYGAMAGLLHIDYQPGSTITWVDYPDDINFPEGSLLANVMTYKILD